MGYTVIAREGHEAFASLAFHPNFTFPTTPTHLIGVGAFILESVARFISPPKIDYEDETFESDALAFAIEHDFRGILVHRLRHIRGSKPAIYRITRQIWKLVYSFNDRQDIDCEALAVEIRNITLEHDKDI